MNNVVINLFGAPGTGKSTIAGQTFAEMKWNKMDVEIVTEYAKDLVWEERQKTIKNQIYVFAKQHNRIHRLLDKVKYIITDSPILLSEFYNQKYGFGSRALRALILEESNKTKTLNIFLKRTKEYNPKGRNETEEQANQYQIDMQVFLDETLGNGNYHVLDADQDTTAKILELLKEYE